MRTFRCGPRDPGTKFADCFFSRVVLKSVFLFQVLFVRHATMLAGSSRSCGRSRRQVEEQEEEMFLCNLSVWPEVRRV